MKNLQLLLILVSVLLLPVISCTNDSDENAADDFLFIEQHKLSHGDLVSGPEPPSIQIDFPTYTYDSDSAKLTGIINFDIDDNLKVIFGSGMCLTGTAGGGCGTGLTGIYEVPFTKGNFELLKLENSGRVVFEYKNEVHSLNIGEDLTLITTRFDTVNVEGVISISKITDTDRITNFGFISSQNISKWEW